MRMRWQRRVPVQRIKADTLTPITLRVNGRQYRAAIEPRMLLSDFLREECGLTGTHVGCEHGVCGACTVLVDGVSVRSCLMLAVQARGCEVSTVEGLSSNGELGAIQAAFWDNHGLQCGFCTPGILMTVAEFLAENPDPADDEIRARLSGNLCR